MKTHAYLMVLLVFILAQCPYDSIFAQGSGAGAKKNYKPIWLSDCEKQLEEFKKEIEVDPVQNVLPLWGKALRDEGYSLPLPFGVGASFIAMNQTNTIADFKLLVDGELLPYDLRVYNAQSTDINYTFRPDIWVLPFLNVYGVLGYTQGSIQPNIIVPGIQADLPVLGPVDIVKPFEINKKIEYKGTTYGAGATASGGFKSYFFIVDYNYTLSDMDVIPQTVHAQTLSTRVGVSLDALNTIGKGTFWIGAMYLQINQKVSEIINMAETDPEIAAILGDEIGYEMELGVKEPLNYLVGGSWQMNPRMNLMIEAGVGDRSQIMVGFDFRF
ncbi:MAG TPA: hypothetical protein DDX98_15565 [Bacteroidales bacterium]|jgi:hypothetical protein|nr:hypothetical protein [Bacteroidales bacterium]